MSADIIPFVPRPRSVCRPPDETSIPVHLPAQPDDLVMDHADTAPCEYWPIRAEGDEESAFRNVGYFVLDSVKSRWAPSGQ